MKTEIQISTVLSWINIVIGGMWVFAGLLAVLMMGNMVMLLPVLLIASIVLHSYASLQLIRSLKDPSVPLSTQTPMGIRMVGFLALFFSVSNIISAVTVWQNAGEFVEKTRETLPEQLKDFDIKPYLRGMVIFLFIFNLGISINVLISMRLLRRYQRRQAEGE